MLFHNTNNRPPKYDLRLIVGIQSYGQATRVCLHSAYASLETMLSIFKTAYNNQLSIIMSSIYITSQLPYAQNWIRFGHLGIGQVYIH